MQKNQKWIFLVILVVIIGVAFVSFSSAFQEQGETQTDTLIVSNISKREPPIKKVQTIEMNKNQIFQGDLLLVNNTFPLKENSVKEDIVSLSTIEELEKQFGSSTHSISLSKEAGLAFLKMMEAAKQDGLVHFSLNSGFRSFEEQAKLYKQMGSAYALPPGYSEHNTGLAIDVGSTLMKMEHAPEGKWMAENAWEYGFILRYPKDKTAITGIEYEPWHFRYVGLPHSIIMKEKDLVLEEYIEFLEKEKNVTTTIDNKQYYVTYHSALETIQIATPILSSYEISGTNIDGFIVTRYR